MSTPTARPVVRRSRVLAAALVALVVAAAAGSTLAWFATPHPTVDDATSVAAALLGDASSVTGLQTVALDPSGIGPTGVRGVVDPPLPIAAAGEQDEDGAVAGLRAAFVAAGFTDVLLVRGDGPLRLEGRRDGVVVSLTDERLQLSPLVPWWVPASMVLAGATAAWFQARRSARRQVVEGSRGSPRWRTTLSWVVLPVGLACTLALPVFLQPGRDAALVGDYGSFVGRLLVSGATLWLPVAVVIGALAWVRFDWRARRETDPDVVR